ncbi:MAG: Mu transposase C-terminal domain-containing protein [Planctomycetes bacterium]|nr:Mu transposase C-terminal domain-containing protein [Planctomycetota bacterium]
MSPVHTALEATQRHELWRVEDALEEHASTGELPLTRWRRIEGNARIPSEEELRWAFRGEVERTVGKLGEIQWSGKLYEAPHSHRRTSPYRVTLRFDLLDAGQVWIEDEDGSHHPCPLYRVRSHTERRRRRPRLEGGLSFRALFEGDEPGAGDSSPEAFSL